MLKRLFKSKKAQNTAEYAILISLVVAGIVAMQTYAQRALQGRVKAASDLMTSIDGGGGTTSTDWSDAGATMNTTKQYEPYYLKQEYNVERRDNEAKNYGVNSAFDIKSAGNRTRAKGGYQATTYCATEWK